VLLLVVISGLSIVLTEGMSNAATVAVILPICFGLFDTAGLDPRLAVFAVAIPAGLAFSLPMGTPPNAIAISSGFYRVSDVAKRGVILSIIAWGLFILMALFYWPLIGLHIIP
jgi:sodium-dependent dicarboxylate transporter 2/3/5